MTRLSIALCTYNGEAFLEEQLQSYLDQTRLPDELVARDDGSTDTTVEILQRFAGRAPFPVRVVAGSENLGYARNFEATIRLCTGDLIALSDQDDVWLPHKLERLEAALGNDLDALLAFSDAELVDRDLDPIGETMWQTLRFRPTLQRRAAAGGPQSPLLAGTYVTGATVCFRCALVSLSLPFPIAHWHDAWLALVATLHGRIVPVAEPLVLYRQHGSNTLGAPAHSGSIRAKIVRAMHDREYNAISAELSARLRDILLEARVRTASPEHARWIPAALGRAVQHHSFRADLPTHPRRVGAVFRELAHGRYHAFSRGIETAVRDLLR